MKLYCKNKKHELLKLLINSDQRSKRLKEQIKQTLEFNQATKQIEPLDIFTLHNRILPKQHKFKVGGDKHLIY